MVAQSIASRSKRHKMEPEDELMGRVLEAVAWMRKNVVLVSVVVGLTAVVLIAFFWYSADRERREEDAAIAFLPAEQAFASGDPAVAVRELDLFIQRHNGTMPSAEARLMLAEVHLREGQAAEALDALGNLAEDLDNPFGPQAAMLTGTAQEAAGEDTAAIATYLRVGESAENSFRREEGLAAAARLREQTGDLAGAGELYARLAEMTDNPTSRAMYEMRRAEVEARAAYPQQAAATPAPAAADSAATVTDPALADSAAALADSAAALTDPAAVPADATP